MIIVTVIWKTNTPCPLVLAGRESIGLIRKNIEASPHASRLGWAAVCEAMIGVRYSLKTKTLSQLQSIDTI